MKFTRDQATEILKEAAAGEEAVLGGTESNRYVVVSVVRLGEVVGLPVASAEDMVRAFEKNAVKGIKGDPDVVAVDLKTLLQQADLTPGEHTKLLQLMEATAQEIKGKAEGNSATPVKAGEQTAIDPKNKKPEKAAGTDTPAAAVAGKTAADEKAVEDEARKKAAEEAQAAAKAEEPKSPAEKELRARAAKFFGKDENTKGIVDKAVNTAAGLGVASAGATAVGFLGWGAVASAVGGALATTAVYAVPTALAGVAIGAAAHSVGGAVSTVTGLGRAAVKGLEKLAHGVATGAAIANWLGEKIGLSEHNGFRKMAQATMKGMDASAEWLGKVHAKMDAGHDAAAWMHKQGRHVNAAVGSAVKATGQALTLNVAGAARTLATHNERIEAEDAAIAKARQETRDKAAGKTVVAKKAEAVEVKKDKPAEAKVEASAEAGKTAAADFPGHRPLAIQDGDGVDVRALAQQEGRRINAGASAGDNPSKNKLGDPDVGLAVARVLRERSTPSGSDLSVN